MDHDDAVHEKTVLSSNTVRRYDEGTSNEELLQSDPNDEPTERKKSFWSDSTTRQKILFVLIVYGHATVFMCVATPFAFMANYMVAKGGAKEDATVVVELVMLTMALSSLFFGRYQMFIGTKKLFWGGLLCFGISQAVFGALEYAPNATTIVAVGSVIKVIQGCGQGAYLVAALTVLCQEFPEHAVTAFGIAETFASVGYTSGPFLGSVLFSVSRGILMPFLISILLLIPLIPAGRCFVKDYNTTRHDNTSISGTEVINNPVSVLILGMATSLFGVFGTVNVLSSVYLMKRGFSIIEVGIALVLLATAFGSSAFVVGHICGVGNKSRRAVLVLGFLGLAGMPFSFTPTQTRAGAYVIMVAYGIFGASGMISSFGELLHLAVGKQPELKSNFALHSSLSGVWNLAYGIGIFIYPLIAASFLRVTTFEFALFTVYMIGICLAVVAAIIFAIYCRIRRNSP